MANKNFEVKHGLSVGGTERISSAGVGTFTDLNVTGTTTTIDTATLQVQDKNIVLNYGTGDTSSSANGAGITIQDAVDAAADATLLWDNSGNGEFDFSHGVTAPSLTIAGAATFDTSTLVVDATNNRVGVNQASPSHALHVIGGDNDEARVRVHNSASGQASLDLDNSEGYFRTFTDAGEYRIYDQTDGAYRLLIDTSGNVGIGTSSPSGAKLHVAGAVKATDLIAHDSTGINLQTDEGTKRLVVTDAGNVGIGVTSPGYKLHVNSKLVVGDAPGVGLSGNTIHVRENSNSGIHFPLVIGGGTHVAGAAFGIGLDPEGYGNRNKIAILAEGNGQGYSRGKLHFAIEGSGNSDQVDLSDSRMCILETGSVGIGTTSPDRMFHVKKSDSSGTVAKFENSAGTVYVELNTNNQAGGDAAYLSYDSGQKLGIWTDDTQQMTINASGDVHFNHLSSDFRLRGGVYGSLFDSNPNMNHNIRYHASAGLYFNVGTTNGSFVFEQRGTARFTIDSSGGSNGSDIKLKENVEDITYGLDTVKQLQPRKFDWKGEDIPTDEKAGIGFIAQEVESIIPELISEKEHPDDTGDGSKNTKMMNYGAMTSVLVKAIQELEARVKELEG